MKHIVADKRFNFGKWYTVVPVIIKRMYVCNKCVAYIVYNFLKEYAVFSLLSGYHGTGSLLEYMVSSESFSK